MVDELALARGDRDLLDHAVHEGRHQHRELAAEVQVRLLPRDRDARVALAWVLSRPFVTSVIIGAKSRAQLDDNLAAATLSLTSDEARELDEVSALPPEYPGWMVAFQNREPRA